ncbi:hypothetical protein CMV_009184 [Castanea mollissima]|uniref:Uncharacterized protein n=1 Tax=Castanea mollissima TaxID=60419 RepID=A0A8J4RPM7_9ROSI|nr:hypothetical protein CMV_009184 [Castanea mollissima]
MMGLSYTGCCNVKVEADEDIEDENTEDCEDDDENETEDEFRGQYCVICSKLDISRKRVIHDPQWNKGLCGIPLKKNCTSGKAPPPSAIPQSKGTSSTTLIGFDWQFILTGLGFGVGAAVVVAPLTFWEKGRKWHNNIIDKILLVILPMMGLSYTGCYNVKVEADEDIEDENTEDSEDDDDENKMEDEEFCRRYCVICSKVDISRKRVIHDPQCTCHNSPPISSSSSTSSSSS